MGCRIVSCVDTAIVFHAEREQLIGVISAPTLASDAGLLMIVGGPQYRAGSHRQFVALARHAANAGIATLRFDCRGKGDSTGAPSGFEDCDVDIAAAIDALMARCPSVRRVFLWGLCDGASAALLYMDRRQDARVAGVCILNPWVRSATTLARAQVKHYYGQRLFEREFWRKLLRGGVDIRGAIREFVGKLRLSRVRTDAKAGTERFQDRMASALRRYGGQVLLILSGRDLTAKEFMDHAASDPVWSGVLRGDQIRRHHVEEADHTFSTAEWRAQVEAATVDWIISATTSQPAFRR